MQVPESPEVIATAADHLMGLYRLVCSSRKTRHRDALTREMIEISGNPQRTLRVALALGTTITDELRPNFDLSDPDAGLYFSNADQSPPAQGELAAGMFLNYLLRHNADAAQGTFHELADYTDAQEIRNFLGLILAVAAAA